HVADFVFRQHVSVDVSAAVAHVRRIGGGDHGVNAGNLFSFAGVDTHDLRVSVLASQDAAVELVFQGQVGTVNAGAYDALDATHSRGACAYYRVFNFGPGVTPSSHSIGGECFRVDV